MTTAPHHRRSPLGLFPDKPTPRLYDHTVEVLRVRHYSRRTQDAYIHWIRRYIEFHDRRHPRELDESDVNRFLIHLAVKEHVAASTQNQALSAILFLYEHVLEQPLDRIDGVVRARHPKGRPDETRNACVVAENKTRVVVANVDEINTSRCRATVCEVLPHPFAIFECKRVGVEEGVRKGPQTIEKAKQGAYVARTVSSLQKVRLRNGSFQGVLELCNGTFHTAPCSNEHSIVKADMEYMLPKVDGLKAEWNYRTIYVNPPYGADRQHGTTIRDWLRKCAEAHSKHGAEVLALMPVATNTRHWKFYVWGAATAVAFLYDTRLRFLVNGRDSGKGAPMSCAMVYWGQQYDRFERVFLKFGAVVDVRHLHDKNVGRGEPPDLFDVQREESAV